MGSGARGASAGGGRQSCVGRRGVWGRSGRGLLCLGWFGMLVSLKYSVLDWRFLGLEGEEGEGQGEGEEGRGVGIHFHGV